MKKNNTAEKAILDAKKITNALKESTEKTLRDIVSEAISAAIEDDEETMEDDNIEQNGEGSQEEQGVETEITADGDAAEDAAEGEEAPEEPEVTDIEGDEEESDEEWSDMEDYKVGDDEFDVTGVDGETALNVYSKLGDDDAIVVKKQDDGSYELKDEETGAEYVIELNPEGEESEMEPEEGEFELELDATEDSPESEESEDEIEIDLGGDEGEDEGEDEEEEGDEQPLNEDDNLGYTDNYQDKDPIEGLKNHETAPNGAKDWNKGIPTDTKKPWAGKDKGKPFEKQVNECGMAEGSQEELEEGTNVGGAVQQHSMSKTNQPKNRKENGPKVKHNVSAAGEFEAQVNESKVQKIIAKAQAILEENKKYKQAIDEIKKSLYEAAILNINYGKVVSLLVNETATKDEKKSIVERFANVKSEKEGTQLYESIKRELNEAKKSAPIIEHTISANSSKTINETPIYTQKSNPSISLMERMDNLYKKKNVINESTKTKSNDAIDLMNRMDNLYKH